MFEKKILNILFMIVCSMSSPVWSMAAQMESSVIKIEDLPYEIMLLIFEQCFTGDNLYDYFDSAVENVKNIKAVCKHFNSFKKGLIKTIKHTIKRRYLKDIPQIDHSDSMSNKLANDLIHVFKELRQLSQSDIDYSNKVEQLEQKAAQLIVAGILDGSTKRTLENINVEYDNLTIGHSIKIPILQFISRTNLFVRLIPFLYCCGLDLNKQDEYLGNTPLHSATALLHLEAIKTLCKYGADVNIQNKEKNTVLHYLVEQIIKWQNKKQIEEMTKCEIIFNMVSELGDLNIKNGSDETVLDLLVNYEGNDDKLRILSCLSDLNLVNQENNIQDERVTNFIAQFLKKPKSA